MIVYPAAGLVNLDNQGTTSVISALIVSAGEIIFPCVSTPHRILGSGQSAFPNQLDRRDADDIQHPFTEQDV